MKTFKIINIIITILNGIFIIAINTLYFQLPVPNKIYLRDIKTGGNLPNSFINLSIIGLIINILLWLIYLFRYGKNKKIAFFIIFEIVLIVVGILYQL